MEKYKEIAEKLISNLDNHGNSVADLYEFNDIIKAMCQLAEEVENNILSPNKVEQNGSNIIEILELIYPLIPLDVFKHIRKKFDNLYTKEQVDEIKKEIIDSYLGNPGYIWYTKEQVEELLQKQKELNLKNIKIGEQDKEFKEIICYYEFPYILNNGNKLVIDEDSILNTKLKLK